MTIVRVRRGFLEWLMNRHTRPYGQLINKLIELFEDLQYENKEKTIKTLERLMRSNTIRR